MKKHSIEYSVNRFRGSMAYWVKVIFVDTSGCYALFVPTDNHHQAAARYSAKHDDLGATDAIVVETLTLDRYFSRFGPFTAIP